MTIYDLQTELKKRIEKIAENNAFHDLKVYLQNLPPLKFEGDADKVFPHCIVSAGDGADGETSHINICLTFGTKDTAPDLQGYVDICHLIEMVRLNFAENPWIAGKFEIKKPINFTFSDGDEDSYPHFFGGIWFDVAIPSPRVDIDDLITEKGVE